MMLYLTNSAGLFTRMDSFTVHAQKISKEDVIILLTKKAQIVSEEDRLSLPFDICPVLSAIGHKPTAEFLTQLLGIQIPYARIQVDAGYGDKILAISLGKRLEEGQILSIEEMEKIPISFLLYRFTAEGEDSM